MKGQIMALIKFTHENGVGLSGTPHCVFLPVSAFCTCRGALRLEPGALLGNDSYEEDLQTFMGRFSPGKPSALASDQRDQEWLG